VRKREFIDQKLRFSAKKGVSLSIKARAETPPARVETPAARVETPAARVETPAARAKTKLDHPERKKGSNFAKTGGAFLP
jgi:hypothetical protein